MNYEFLQNILYFFYGLKNILNFRIKNNDFFFAFLNNHFLLFPLYLKIHFLEN